MKRCPHCLRKLPYDKFLHFSISFLLTLSPGCAVVHYPRYLILLIGFLWAMCIGILKELYDANNGGEFSWDDLLFDLLGATLGILAIATVFYVRVGG